MEKTPARISGAFLKTSLIFLYLSIIATFVSAQKKMNTYEPQWKKIEDLAGKQGLPQSALTEIKKIYTAAKKEGNDVQVIKALLYRSRLMEETAEDASEKNILEISGELQNAREPARSILHSLLASVYWQYFQENRWKLYDRIPTSGNNPSDPATWTADDFHQAISRHYLLSVKQTDLLQRTSLAPFGPLINSGNTRRLRPTLYDLLAHAALEYFTNTERDIRNAAEDFEITDTAAFAPAPEFASHPFSTPDSASLYYRAILLYQELTRFHLTDNKPDALIDLDLNRLKFVFWHSVSGDKQERFSQALSRISNRWPTESATAQAAYLQARLIYQDGMRYQPETGVTENRMAWKTARDLCEMTIERFPKSEGSVNCQMLLRELNQKELSFETEKINLPGLPFRTKVSYRNIRMMYYRIIKLDDSLVQKLTEPWLDTYWKILREANPLTSGRRELPFIQDLRAHSVEIRMDPLPPGRYAMLASGDPSFSLRENPLSAQYFHVSAIAFLNRGPHFFVLHRETGKPLSNARIQTWTSSYDYSKNRYVSQKKESYIADIDGFFTIDNTMPSQPPIRLEITWQNDRLFEEDPVFRAVPYSRPAQTSREEFEAAHRKVFLFTDRGIYRPGQIAWFKGIMVTRDLESGKSKIVSGFPAVIRLTNANGEIVDSLELTSNEFGSFSGRFKLPATGLTGQFSLSEAKSPGHAYFNIEEYKRPTFQVGYRTPDRSYRLNDTVSITGTALAYSGQPVAGARVRYRVTRLTRFPYPWLKGGMDFRFSRPAEIAHGQTETAPDGTFLIRYHALPDKGFSKETEPVFEYRITADITDLNGETRSGESVLSLGYHTSYLQLELPDGDRIQTDSSRQLWVSVSDFSGNLRQASVQIRLYRLAMPERLIRPRYWSNPDTFVLSKQEFLSNFPYDEYDRESQKQNWAKLELLENLSQATGPEITAVTLTRKRLSLGWYLIEAETPDKDGTPIPARVFARVTDPNTGLDGLPVYIQTSVSSQQAQPGDSISFVTATGTDELWIIRHVDRKHPPAVPAPAGRKVPRQAPPLKQQAMEDPGHPYRFIRLSKGSQSLPFTLTENDRGGFGISQAFIKHNRFFTTSDIVSMPWSNKELDIQVGSYRDKTRPGSEEQWSVTIKGSAGEKISAEMLASMYDASLDQFIPFNWQKPDLYPVYPFVPETGQPYSWMSQAGFRAVNSENRYQPEKDITPYRKNYDRLLWQSGYQDFMPLGRNKRMAAELAMAAAPTTDSVQNKDVDPARQAADQSGESPSASPTATRSGMPPEFQARKDFSETVFFLPDLHTDSAGRVTFQFRMPEALTTWKAQLLAHTRDLATGMASRQIITRKELMVQPNTPRFFREGDQSVLSVKISSMADREMTGQARLQLVDPATGDVVDGWFKNIFPVQYFTLPAGGSTAVQFTVDIPYSFNSPLLCRVTAQAGSYSDGEEHLIPVLSNRILVTESLPLFLKGSGSKVFKLDKLIESGKFPSLTNHALTLEFSANPAWYAVQALPYLTDFPLECSEQVFNRYYANSLAATIVSGQPKIKTVVDSWIKTDADAMKSRLELRSELKNILLEETPWVLEAKNETDQKKNIVRLFDSARLSAGLEQSLAKLKQMQLPNGAFPWFNGGPDDRFITQYIVTGFGRLADMKDIPRTLREKSATITRPALQYLLERIRTDYDKLKREKADLSGQQIGPLQIQFLYALSLYPELKPDNKFEPAITYYTAQAKKFWLQQGRQQQAMIAIVLNGSGDIQTARAILASLKEKAIRSETAGMYWKESGPSYFWNQAPVETQAIVIEAFAKISNDYQTVSDLRQWLLLQKQTHHWSSTKATADACYALLLQGTDWLAREPQVSVRLGTVSPLMLSNQPAQQGTGYMKTFIEGKAVKPEYGNLQVTVRDEGKPASGAVSWGALYWQYFEDIDRVTMASGPLQIEKKWFIETLTDKGPVLKPVEEGRTLKVGDKLQVRIILRSDRELEYVHLKDLRASGFEPVQVLSAYSWKGGLGYYESTRDAASHFFFNVLPRGTHVFQYPLFVNHAGEFSAGMATVQCMYAPEFTAHSEGARIRINQ